MIGTLASLLSPLISGFILMLGFGLIGILLPVRMGLEQMSPDTIGLVLSMYAVGMLAGGLYSKDLINRAGHIRMFAATAALSAISILGCGLYTDPILWGFLRMLLGFCNACAFTAIDSWLSGVATRETRGRILASNQISVMSAIFIGQFGLNLADPTGNTLFVLAGMVMSFAVIPMVMSRSAGPPIEEGGHMPLKKLFIISPLGVITCLFGGLLYSGSLNMLPLFGGHYGIDGLRLSQFMGAAVFGAMALQFPVGYLSDRIDRRTLMLVLLLICAGAGIAVPFAAAAGQFALMMLAVGLSVGVMACLYPMGISETFDKLQQKDMVAAMGGLIAVYALGSMVGPYASSLVIRDYGADALFVFLAIMEGLLLVIVLYRMQVREALPVEDQESYVPMVYEGGNAIELDPRSEFHSPEELFGREAQYALSVAENHPGLAVNIAKTLGEMSPAQASRLAGAISQIDGVNAVRLFNAMSGALPDSKLELAEAVASNSPEYAADIIRQIVQRNDEELTDYVTAITRAAPESGADVLAAAAETMAESAPEDVVELAQSYAETLSESLDEMRPADREHEHSEDWISEVVKALGDLVPEQSGELARAMAEALPDAAPQIAAVYGEMLREHQEEGAPAPDTYQRAGEFVSRLSQQLPDHGVDIATAVIEAIPRGASLVIDSLRSADPEFAQLSSDLSERPESLS